MGGSIAKTLKEATHLVMGQLGRTNKLINAITLGLIIIPDTWVRQCDTERKFVPESAFKFDTKDFDEMYKCDLNKTLSMPIRNKLFTNRAFYITPSVFPTASELKEMIELAGGVVEKKRRSLPQIEAVNATVPYTYIILTAQNDLHLVYDCLKHSNQKIVASSEVVFNSVLNQIVNVDDYLVKVNQD